jgi:acetate kinase
MNENEITRVVVGVRFRADVIVNDLVIVELRSVERLAPGA